VIVTVRAGRALSFLILLSGVSTFDDDLRAELTRAARHNLTPAVES